MKLNHLILAATVAMGVFAASPTEAATAFYMRLDGIDGESTDANHEGWIDLLSVDWSMEHPIDPASGRPTGRAIADALQVAKELDKATPKLIEAAATGAVIPTLTLELVQPVGTSGARATYYKYELTNVLVTSYDTGSSSQSESRPTESFSLNFEQIKVTYTEYGKDGSAKGNVEYEWKVEEGES